MYVSKVTFKETGLYVSLKSPSGCLQAAWQGAASITKLLVSRICSRSLSERVDCNGNCFRHIQLLLWPATMIWSYLDVKCPPKLLCHSSSWAGQDRENIMKGSCIEIRTRRSLSDYCHVQNRLILGKVSLICYQPNQSRTRKNKNETPWNTFLPPLPSACT